MTPLIVDVTDEAAISVAAASVAEIVGKRGLAGLVNNAGIGVPAPIEFQPMADFRETHFVVAGGQIKSMLSWLGYMKHGESQERVFGLNMYPPNLKPDFEEQARSFLDGIVDEVFNRPAVASVESSTVET